MFRFSHSTKLVLCVYLWHAGPGSDAACRGLGFWRIAHFQFVLHCDQTVMVRRLQAMPLISGSQISGTWVKQADFRNYASSRLYFPGTGKINLCTWLTMVYFIQWHIQTMYRSILSSCFHETYHTFSMQSMRVGGQIIAKMKWDIGICIHNSVSSTICDKQSLLLPQ